MLTSWQHRGGQCAPHSRKRLCRHVHLVGEALLPARHAMRACAVDNEFGLKRSPEGSCSLRSERGGDCKWWPPSLPFRDEILIATFGVVAFSVILQGLTMPPLLRRASK